MKVQAECFIIGLKCLYSRRAFMFPVGECMFRDAERIFRIGERMFPDGEYKKYRDQTSF